MPETLLTKAARVALATVIKNKPLFLSVALGNPAWGSTPPAPAVTVTDLTTSPLVWKKAMVVAYAEEAPEDGLITLLDGSKWNLTATPTETLYVKFTFEPGEAGGLTFREFGVFMDTVTEAGLPEGQTLFTPAEIDAQGTLLALQRRAAVTRDPEIREFFQIVITI